MKNHTWFRAAERTNKYPGSDECDKNRLASRRKGVVCAVDAQGPDLDHELDAGLDTTLFGLAMLSQRQGLQWLTSFEQPDCPQCHARNTHWNPLQANGSRRGRVTTRRRRLGRRATMSTKTVRAIEASTQSVHGSGTPLGCSLQSLPQQQARMWCAASRLNWASHQHDLQSGDRANYAKVSRLGVPPCCVSSACMVRQRPWSRRRRKDGRSARRNCNDGNPLLNPIQNQIPGTNQSRGAWQQSL